MKRAFELRAGDYWREVQVLEIALCNGNDSVLVMAEDFSTTLVGIYDTERYEDRFADELTPGQIRDMEALRANPPAPSDEMLRALADRESPVVPMGAGHQEAGI